MNLKSFSTHLIKYYFLSAAIVILHRVVFVGNQFLFERWGLLQRFLCSFIASVYFVFRLDVVRNLLKVAILMPCVKTPIINSFTLDDLKPAIAFLPVDGFTYYTFVSP